MNNKQLIKELSKRLNRDEKDVNSLLSGFTNVLKDSLSNLDIIAIPGFGEFEALRKEEYISVDDATGKKVLYPPCIEVNFNASSLLKKKMID
jgi:nucleoid DNA-binding protein